VNCLGLMRKVVPMAPMVRVSEMLRTTAHAHLFVVRIELHRESANVSLSMNTQTYLNKVRNCHIHA
jgi:hypothetical protein